MKGEEMTEEQELSQRLQEAPPSRNADNAPIPDIRTDVDYSLWQVQANGTFRPGSRTQEELPSGAYQIGHDDRGIFFKHTKIIQDSVIELPEKSHIRVLEGIRKFWGVKERYDMHGLVYKRGVLLWGPPGGGKTVTAGLLINEIIRQHDGIVLICSHPGLCAAAIQVLRTIEHKRPLIVLLEDIDEIIANHGEHALLAMLDGEYQVDNVVFVATTNYPERLGARIVNRPSRFDERVKIGMPTAESRLAYLRHVTRGMDLPLDKWCADTEGLSIAHLRELVVAIVCLEQDYETVLERLRHMEIRPKEEEGFRRKGVGLPTGNAAVKILEQTLSTWSQG